MEAYRIDPGAISLSWFFELTRVRRMLPSRKALHDQMEERFDILDKAGIRNLAELISTLGSKSKIQVFSSETGLEEEYLVLLKREAGSYIARPFPLSDFPGIPFEYTEALRARGIKTTRDLFEGAVLEGQRTELSRETGIPLSRIQELYSLCDLSRITGVGGVFARVVYEAGIRSTREFAGTDAYSHYRKYMEVIDRFGYAAGHFVEEDIQYCIDYASVICQVMDETNSPDS